MHAPPFTVAIDPGHGGANYTGAAHRDAAGNVDMLEKDRNLEVALRLDARLRAAGYRTVLTRDGDYSLTRFDPYNYRASQRIEFQARVDKVNQAQADIVVSLHFNGSDDPSASGLEVYYNPDRSFGDKSRMLAISVHDALISAIRSQGYDVKDRGIKNDAEVGGDPANPHSYLLGTDANFRASLMPGIIAEPLFLTDDEDAAQLAKPAVRDAIAAAYQSGIDAYFKWLTSGR